MDYLRTATVNGPTGADQIFDTYVDSDGDSVGMFRGNDTFNDSLGIGDWLVIDADAGDDVIQISIPYERAHSTDNLTVLGGDGADQIAVWTPWFVWEGEIDLQGGAGNDDLDYNGAAQVRMDGGTGDDVVHLALLTSVPTGPNWNNALPQLTGGSGADQF